MDTSKQSPIESGPPNRAEDDLSRRRFIGSAVAGLAISTHMPTAEVEAAPLHSGHLPCSFTLNGDFCELTVDPRVTLLDVLREQLHLTGTKKGCDHGQCGACTVLVNGERINSCLALAISHDGDKITTIEGLAEGERLHPMQAAFLEHDGFQCGFCTSGQICSAVAMLNETRRGALSAVTPVSAHGPVDLTEPEVRERMSGNICRCGAYPNIVAAVRAVYREERS